MDKLKQLTDKQKIYRKYLQSSEWIELKIDLFEKRGKKCEKCDSKYNIQVHHLTYRNVFNEEPEDLIILCAKCHQKEHDPPKKIKRKVKKFKILSLAKKLELKKTNKKAFKMYIKKLNKPK